MSYPNAIEVCRSELFTKEVELRERYPGQMVETFNDWCFADGRQPGDYGIVKTDYGYHIMFFVGAGDEIYWFQTAKEDYLSDLAVKIQDEITAKYTFVSYVDQAALVDVLTAANDSEAAQ